jgi:tetratricopeptide (TPR) repeat protein
MSCIPEIYPPHILAQKLNEHGAFCIEVGYYERAIPALVEALHLAEQAHVNNKEDTCRCEHCSLESCMIFSQSNLQQSATQSKKCQSLSDESDEEAFVYRQPIRVTPQSMQAGHNMGSTLPMIITFNLALAYHLPTIEEEGPINRDSLQKVLQLYELAYRWQLEDQCNEQVNSLSFTMTLINNLGGIHRAVGNHSKYVMCLQHLLSTMMFVVDCNDREEDSAIQMDGFFRNTSQLILHDQCAAAA